MYWSRILDGQCVLVSKLTKSWWGLLKVIEYAHCLLLVVVVPQVQLNTGGLQYIRLAQPVSGAQVVQGQIQTLTTSTQQVQHKNATNVMICLWNPGSIYHSSCCFIIYVASFKKKKSFVICADTWTGQTILQCHFHLDAFHAEQGHDVHFALLAGITDRSAARATAVQPVHWWSGKSQSHGSTNSPSSMIYVVFLHLFLFANP